MRLRVDVSKNVITAASSQEGEFVTSTTTDAPFSASASPSPVMELRPDLGDAATASCPCSRSLLTSFDPISPLPPITTIFMIATSIFVVPPCVSPVKRKNTVPESFGNIECTSRLIGHRPYRYCRCPINVLIHISAEFKASLCV